MLVDWIRPLLGRPLVTSPPSSRVARGATPDLLPAAVYSDEAVDHVVVTVDRAGADLVRRGWGEQRRRVAGEQRR